MGGVHLSNRLPGDRCDEPRLRCLGGATCCSCSLIGSAVDTALFFTIAFSASVTVFGAGNDEAISWAWEGVPLLGQGAVMPLWVSLAVADWGVKLAIALVALVPFRLIVAKLSPTPA